MCAESNKKEGKKKRREVSLKSPLSRLLEVDNVIFTCVVDPNGEIVGSEGKIDNKKLRSYGAMCATMFAAAKEASEGSDSKGLEITITDNDPAGEIYIRGLERDYILVTRTTEDKNQAEIQKAMQDVANLLTENKAWMRDQLISTLKQKYKGEG